MLSDLGNACLHGTNGTIHNFQYRGSTLHSAAKPEYSPTITNMAGLRRLDAFVKPREDLRTRSALGGLITLVAGSAASILFLAQVTMYLVGATRHSLHLSESKSLPVPLLDGILPSRNQRKTWTIPLKAHVTFPHLQCDWMDVTHDGASFRDGELEKTLGRNSIQFRKPSSDELTAALGKEQARIPKNQGCTVQGTLQIPKVGGTFSVTVTRKAWSEAKSRFMFGPFGEINTAPPKFFNVR